MDSHDYCPFKAAIDTALTQHFQHFGGAKPKVEVFIQRAGAKGHSLTDLALKAINISDKTGLKIPQMEFNKIVVQVIGEDTPTANSESSERRAFKASAPAEPGR